MYQLHGYGSNVRNGRQSLSLHGNPWVPVLGFPSKNAE